MAGFESGRIADLRFMVQERTRFPGYYERLARTALGAVPEQLSPDAMTQSPQEPQQAEAPDAPVL